MLRRLGLSTAWRLRRAMAERRQDEGLSRDGLVDGRLVAVGSILLIFRDSSPIFAGLALAAPSVRNWLGDKFQNGRTSRKSGRSSGPTLVELDPGEWSRTDRSGQGPASLEPTKSPF